MKIVLLLLLCATVIEGWSTFHKGDLQHEKFYQQAAHPLKECKDKISEELCDRYKPYCYNISKITKVCKKTCGDCPAVSPMSCKASKHGCCWDNITTSGPNGQDCPKCIDRNDKCKKVKDMCSMAHIRRICPITCEVSACIRSLCHDDPIQAEFCPHFKMNGYCEIDESLMKMFCKKTCNFCDKDNVEVAVVIASAPRDEGQHSNVDSVATPVKDEQKQQQQNHIVPKENNAEIMQKIKNTVQKKDESNVDDEALMINLLQKEVEKELKKKQVIEKPQHKTLTKEEEDKANDALFTLLLEEQEKEKPRGG